MERDFMGRCVICGDTAKTGSGECFYCNWKGTTGPGALAKSIIKKRNKEIDDGMSDTDRTDTP